MSPRLVVLLGLPLASTSTARRADEPVRRALSRLDFAGYLGDGFVPAPGPGQLDSDTWRITGMNDGVTSFGGNFVGGDFSEGLTAGGGVEGGLFAFTVAPGDIAFGMQQKD